MLGRQTETEGGADDVRDADKGGAGGSLGQQPGTQAGHRRDAGGRDAGRPVEPPGSLVRPALALGRRNGTWTDITGL